eukprot:scaffold418_cov181-Alexandrium_tamarense.AAC.5
MNIVEETVAWGSDIGGSNNDKLPKLDDFMIAGLLFTNSILILHRKRFLSKYGLDDVNNMGCNPSERPFQVQAIGLLQAVHYLKLPYNIDGVWVKGRVVVQTTCLQNPKFMSLDSCVLIRATIRLSSDR